MTVTINGNGTITPTSAINPAGSILQVVQGIKTDTFSTAANLQTKAAITGLTVNITPTSSSNKILVIMQLGVVGASGDTTVGGTILRDSTAIGIADTAGSRTRNTFGCGIPANSDWRTHNVSHTILDSPSTTSQITYSVKIGGNGSKTVTINYDERNTDSATDSTISSSTITAIEVAA